ncbi:MAG: hypothetical protein HC916_14330 [Coleofasciculaceae cyanobacterium SM2_1_6]|nr:hypothetical protein [Coleofasciculaceae cyanobacterium SM2_1_6]
MKIKPSRITRNYALIFLAANLITLGSNPYFKASANTGSTTRVRPVTRPRPSPTPIRRQPTPTHRTNQGNIPS